MKQSVQLKVVGTHQELNNSSDKEEIIQECEGSYFLKDNIHYIFYDEIHEDKQVTKNKLVIVPNESVHIVKKGAIQSDMFLKLGEKMETNYQTPYTTMLISFSTDRMNLECEDDRLYLEISYIMGVEKIDHSRGTVMIEMKIIK